MTAFDEMWSTIAEGVVGQLTAMMLAAIAKIVKMRSMNLRLLSVTPCSNQTPSYEENQNLQDSRATGRSTFKTLAMTSLAPLSTSKKNRFALARARRMRLTRSFWLERLLSATAKPLWKKLGNSSNALAKTLSLNLSRARITVGGERTAKCMTPFTID